MQISIHDNCLFDIFYAFDQHIIRVFPQCEKPISKMRKPTKNERVSKKNRFISLFSSKKREILSFCYHPQVLCYQGKMFIVNVNLHLPINKKLFTLPHNFTLLIYHNIDCRSMQCTQQKLFREINRIFDFRFSNTYHQRIILLYRQIV